MPGTMGARSTPARTPACTSRSMTCSRFQGRRRAGLKFPPDVRVHGGDAEGDGCSRALACFDEDVDVALDHGALGHELQRRPPFGEGFNAPAREALAALDGLVGVCRGADGHDFSAPRRTRELGAQALDDIGLDGDEAGEVLTRVQVLEGVVAPCEAVVAVVDAASVGVERPAEAHASHAVECAAALRVDVLHTSRHGPLPR